MKWVHAADLHIDSPLRGLSAYDGAPVERIRVATRRAFSNLIDLCVGERAAMLLLAGDVFDGDWKDFNTGLFFVRELNRLRDVHTRVFIVRGNHDAASEVTRALTLPSHVHEFAADRAETIVVEEHGVAVHGFSFLQRKMPDSLLPYYPAPLDGALNVGLLHTSANGHVDHDTYAPCGVDDLVRKGYDYWALGHVHAQTFLHEEPWVVFPGNLQGRKLSESGPKGCVVVTASEDEVTSVRPVALDAVRWQRLNLSLAGDDGTDELYERAQTLFAHAHAEADGRLVAARLTVTGAVRAHADLVAKREQVENELRARALEFADALWLERIEVLTRPELPFEELSASEGFVGDVLRALAEAKRDPALAVELAGQLQPLVDKLGDELGASGASLALPALLAEVEARLITALVGK
jgi:DNA repair exonuclease SbcCD nuclease subunit